MLTASSLAHFWEFFFAPVGQPWYEGNVWGNVVAIVPCGIIGLVWASLRIGRLERSLVELHRKHDALREQLGAK